MIKVDLIDEIFSGREIITCLSDDYPFKSFSGGGLTLQECEAYFVGLVKGYLIDRPGKIYIKCPPLLSEKEHGYEIFMRFIVSEDKLEEGISWK